MKCHLLVSLFIFLAAIDSSYCEYQNEELNHTAQLISNTNYSAVDTSVINAMPIFMYDTDIGFGFGGKMFLFNQFDMCESIDITLFNSTKGERWYRLVYSIPDFEFRQMKTYPVSLDLIFDYDKIIKNNFYGVGANSKNSDREYYTKEPFEVSLVLGKGFTKNIIGQIGLKYKSIGSTNYDMTGVLINSEDILQLYNVYYASGFINLRYDTRNSFINPFSGTVVSFETEFTLPPVKSNVDFYKVVSKAQKYLDFEFINSTFAFRLEMTNLFGNNLPVQLLIPLGGTNTLRGFPAERFIDKNSILANVEIRTKLYRKLFGIIGLDAGNVFPEFRKLALQNWKINSVYGLRLVLDTFVVRFDIGISNETTGLYFNFGHLF